MKSNSGLTDLLKMREKTYEEAYSEREDRLDQMPGGAQGARPDMSDYCDLCHNLLVSEKELIRGECNRCHAVGEVR
jgi:hypothetical protein